MHNIYTIETKRGSIRCLFWRTFLDELWGDKLLCET
jgi:hypothetical protein